MNVRLPKNIKLQNGLPATVYSIFDVRVRAVFEACMRLPSDPDLDNLTKSGYAIKVRLKRHVVYAVYANSRPEFLMPDLQQNLSSALSGCDFIVYDNHAYRRAILHYKNSNVTISHDPRAKMFLKSIRKKIDPSISILISTTV